MRGYEKMFGHDFNKEVEKYTNLTDFIFSDTEGLLSLTNCSEPCESIDYQTKGSYFMLSYFHVFSNSQS